MAKNNKYETYLTNRMTESANSRLMSINNVNRFLKDLYSSDLSLPSKAQFRNAEQTAVEIYRQASNGQDSSDISEMKLFEYLISLTDVMPESFSEFSGR